MVLWTIGREGPDTGKPAAERHSPWRRGLAVAAAYLAAYLALDWLSAIYPFQVLNIAPWNPSAGASLVLLLLGGVRWMPLAALAPFAAHLMVPHLSAPLLPNLAIAVGEACIYAFAAWLMVKPLRMSTTLGSFRDVARLIGGIMVAAALMAALYVGTFGAFGMVPAGDFGSLAYTYWVGNTIGMLATAPAFLVHRRALHKGLPTAAFLSREFLGEAAVFGLALWVMLFRTWADGRHIIFTLIVPVVLVAARRGVPGITVLLPAMQLCVVLGTIATGWRPASVAKLQFFMLILTIIGLLLGAVISERKRLEERKDRWRSDLEQASRASLGEKLAASLAHELNQPLSALIGYVATCQRMIEALPDAPPRLHQQMAKALAQAERAGAVVAGMNEFFRSGHLRTLPVALRQVLNEMTPLLADELNRAGAVVELRVPEGLMVDVDRLQVEQVLVNLLRNSLEALAGTDLDRKTIGISAERCEDGMVLVTVADNGPGVAPDVAPKIFDPFMTTRPTGTGLGLAISRSIVEGHGGRMWHEPGAKGAVFHFTLPETAGA